MMVVVKSKKNSNKNNILWNKIKSI